MRARIKFRKITFNTLITAGFFFFLLPSLSANVISGKDLYKMLSGITQGKGPQELFEKLNSQPRGFKWKLATKAEFTGNLRILKIDQPGGTADSKTIYLLRKLTGEIIILNIPVGNLTLRENEDSIYSGIDGMTESKMRFNVVVTRGSVDGKEYQFARLTDRPGELLLDQVFRICIILMLFLVMIGMGLTLTVKDFSLVFKKPKGIILGEILQFGVMPLVALAAGRILGFYTDYPYIFVGMILITSIPGGVTSNLMTYYAKGDLALSISMTSFSTVLSLFFTPLLLGLYCANVPDVTIPVKAVILTITILVIIPLFIGMFLRNRWENFAKRATPFFSLLGIIALLFLIIAGVVSNLHVFTDIERYGFRFYSMVFSLTALGLISGAILPKLTGINNYQARAISLESGLRNASLAMAIAILIQDQMGDFYSSMFVVSGIFGLTMYIAGFIAIYIFRIVLPVDEKVLDTDAKV